MFFLPSSLLLVDHITRYVRSPRLEYNKKILSISVQLIYLPFLRA